MPTTDQENTTLAQKFLTGLRTADRAILASVLTEDAIWSLPGASTISGDFQGIDAIHRRAQTIIGHGMKIELTHLLIGRHGIAVTLHNTSQYNGMSFDVHLASAMKIEGGKITAIDTYISNIEMLNAFFV